MSRAVDGHLGQNSFCNEPLVVFMRLQMTQFGSLGKCVNILCVPPFLSEVKAQKDQMIWNLSTKLSVINEACLAFDYPMPFAALGHLKPNF